MPRHILKAGVAVVTLAVITAGAPAVHSTPSATAITKAAEGSARDATRALSRGKGDVAVRYAELTVQLRPQDAAYRALLGKAYLAAGRFFSAKQAFADALQLDAGLSGAALNLALASIATGDFAAAQHILEANAATIAPADLGLAFALAGNPVAAVEILLPAARSLDSNAKTRQNLALAFALAGRWPDARQVALTDLSPADVDARIVEWAAFARPAAASDQVASLLGVTPVADSGLPVQLALVAAPEQLAQAAPADPIADAAPATFVATSLPVAASAPAPAPAAVAVTTATAMIEDASRPIVTRIVFAERREVVQPLPTLTQRAVTTTALARRSRGPAPIATPVAARGNFYVQIGAYDSAAMAKWGWDRARVRYSALVDQTPYTTSTGNRLVRVSTGGFARNDADRICRTIRVKGGACFVRTEAGDRIASWVRTNVQVAARDGHVMRLAAR